VLSVLVTLIFDLLTFQLALNVSHGTENCPANFGISATIRASDLQHDLITLTFEVTAHVGDVDHRTPSLYRV